MDSRHQAQNDSPEQLLDVFKAAALSVTKLYKSSVAAETKARTDGYQECLDDLSAFLDREGQNLGEGGLLRLRKWASERREGRELSPQSSESEEEAEKPTETTSTTTNNPVPAQAQADAMADSAPAAPAAEPHRPVEFVVPSREDFTFQSDHQYPNIELLDLSERSQTNNHTPRPRRSNKTGALRTSGHLGRGAGSKRRMDFDDFFGGCFGGKDPFGGGGGKRSRHT